MHAVGAGGAIAHNIETQISTRRFEMAIAFSRRDAEILGEFGHRLAGLYLVEVLVDNFQTLAHFLNANLITLPAIALLTDGDVKLNFGVKGIRIVLAHF